MGLFMFVPENSFYSISIYVYAYINNIVSGSIVSVLRTASIFVLSAWSKQGLRVSDRNFKANWQV